MELLASSLVADMAIAVRGPGQDWTEAVIADNSDEGLYGLDAVLTYTASESGVHEIEVGCLDPLATAYRFEVVPT